MRRLIDWHVAKSTRTGPAFATLAIAIAIVGALIAEPGILARTSYDQLPHAARAAGGLALNGASVLTLRDGALDAFTASVVDAPAVVSDTLTADALHPLRATAMPLDLVAGDAATRALLGTPLNGSASAVAPPSKPATSATIPPRASHPATRNTPVAAAWNVAPIVTWYGPGFYGGKTACGQRYTRTIVGVASRTLPCGTLIQFQWQGITYTAPVIDRGPFASAAYVFDFSAQLACNIFRPHGQRNGCFTRHDVHWRVVGRRRK